MSVPEGHIAVSHGNLTVNVPRSIFRGYGAVPDEQEAERFRNMISGRYPWLSRNALDVLMANARKEVLAILDRETGGRAGARLLMDAGRAEEAATHLKRHLDDDPGDTDTWYMLGEVLCGSGRIREGYAAIAKGRRSLEK